MQAGKKKNKAVEFLSNAEAHGLLDFASLCILGKMGCGTGSVALVHLLCTHGLKGSGRDSSDAQGTQNSSPTLQPGKEQVQEENTRLMRDGKLRVGWALEERPRGKRLILSSKSKVRLIFLGTPGDAAGELC